MNILQKIFRDNYEIIQYTLHPRDVVMESIDKMINCGAPSFGGAMYGCTHCGNLNFLSDYRLFIVPALVWAFILVISQEGEIY